ncbi:MAG: 3-deoxy-7-phosphoheptulonate synthase [Pseudomonadales bacterium]|nr:3-deoxy-7-phosphoheptulonate synthase [Pseudomonadales bacterium]
MHDTKDVRISRSQPLMTPSALSRELPADNAVTDFVWQSRRDIENVLTGKDSRLLCIVGPCSVHDPKALIDFAHQFQEATGNLSDAILPVLRVYFEKPRSVIGWKGLINDPDLDGSFQISKGLRQARSLLLEVAQMQLPAATEFLDTTFGQYYADLISFGAIGARTVESQVHRELASGLSMPVGFKNGTSGNIKVAVDAIRSAQHPHWFPSLTRAGEPAILESTGNPHGYIILRGGSDTGPNYLPSHIEQTVTALTDHELPASIIVDCSHGNSEKQHSKQVNVAKNLAHQISQGQSAIRGVMLESHLVAGQQDIAASTLTYGQSITDACLALDETIPVLEELAAAVTETQT